MDEEQREVWETVEALNRCWHSGDPATIGEWFSEDMVIVGPNHEVCGRGREACVESYVDFCSKAAVIAFELSDALVEVFGETAFASYAFETRYEMAGASHRDRGRDMFVFARETGRWLAVLRMLMPAGTAI